MKISLDTIRSRSSVRSYDGSPLKAADEAAIRAAFAEAQGAPFGHRSRMALIGPGLAGGRKVGTYGVVTGAPAFIAGVVERGSLACADFGYVLEGVVLRATELGLGTCWLGGIFDRGAIARALGAERGEFVPACSPVGAPAEKMSLQDRIIRGSARSTSRLEARELFFAAEPAAGPGSGRGLAAAPAWAPLGEAGPWAEVLEAVRRAPSASNKQPWRILAEREGPRDIRALHLFMQEDRVFNNALGEVKLQELDMGIAMRHVEAVASSLGLPGSWRVLPAPPAAVAPRRYLSTWTW